MNSSKQTTDDGNKMNAQYRKQGCHLYKLMNGAYVHVYQDAFCKTLKSLVKAYESCED